MPRAEVRLPTVVLLVLLAASARGDNWPRFRGDNGAGLSTQSGIPATWNDDDYAWKIDLPGVGHSSPVIWGKSLFITSAKEDGTQRSLQCLDADSGTERWQIPLSFGRSEKHPKNSWASSTPVTDGERVYLVSADEESQIAAAWDFSGNQIWSRNLGAFSREHGQGASPIVAGDLLIVPNDQPGPSSLLALRVTDGEVVWQVERPSAHTTYSTPMLLPAGEGRQQVICLSQPTGMSSYDLATGALKWQTKPMPMRTVSSPVEFGGVVIATCGSAGTGKYLMAVDTGDAVAAESRIVFERTTQLPYVPTSIARDGLLFLWGDTGVLKCLELPSGEEVWMKRVTGGTFSGSPIWVDGRLFAVSEEGEVFVVRASREYEFLGRTSLGEGSHATPAVANGHLYLRTFGKLFALPAGDRKG